MGNSYTIYNAIEKGNIDYIIERLNEGFDINHTDAKGISLLDYATKHNQKEIVELLIQRGVDNEYMPNMISLITACSCNNIEIAELLLNHGIDPNVKNRFGTRAIFYAVFNGNTELTKLLVSRGAKLKSDLLETACIEDDYLIVDCLVSNKIDINDNKSDILLTAIWNSSMFSLNILINNRIKLDEFDFVGRLPIHHAAKYSKRNIVEKLILSGVNVNAKCIGGAVPLNYALRNNDYAEIMELLLDHGADPEEIYVSADHPLKRLARHGKIECIKKMIVKMPSFRRNSSLGRYLTSKIVSSNNSDDVNSLFSIFFDNQEYHEITLQQLCYVQIILKNIDIQHVARYIVNECQSWLLNCNYGIEFIKLAKTTLFRKNNSCSNNIE